MAQSDKVAKKRSIFADVVHLAGLFDQQGSSEPEPKSVPLPDLTVAVPESPMVRFQQQLQESLVCPLIRFNSHNQNFVEERYRNMVAQNMAHQMESNHMQSFHFNQLSPTLLRLPNANGGWPLINAQNAIIQSRCAQMFASQYHHHMHHQNIQEPTGTALSNFQPKLDMFAASSYQKHVEAPTASATQPKHQPPRFQCSECSRSYSTFNGLSKHRQFHCAAQMKRHFGCKFCDRKYSSLGAMKMHIRTHTLPCKCQICGKAFSRPWLLQGHVRTHTGEKPFRCAHCGRAFADRSNLRAHLQTHSEIKKYRCKSCQKTFSRISLLNKHETNGCSGLVVLS